MKFVYLLTELEYQLLIYYLNELSTLTVQLLLLFSDSLQAMTAYLVLFQLCN
jgi:hypothetical protein